MILPLPPYQTHKEAQGDDDDKDSVTSREQNLKIKSLREAFGKVDEDMDNCRNNDSLYDHSVELREAFLC